MLDRWKNKTWREKKKFSIIVAVISLVVICVNIFSDSKYKKEDLTFKTITLSGKPKFKSGVRGKAGSGSRFYYLELPTKEHRYEVIGANYKYLTNRLEFRTNVKSGTELRIGIIDDNILTMSKGAIEYLQFDKARFYENQKSLFTIYMLFPAFIICSVALFFKERPKIILNDGSYQNISFGAILFIVSILNFILLIFIFGYDFIMASEFIE